MSSNYGVPGFGVLVDLWPYLAATDFVAPELAEKAAMRPGVLAGLKRTQAMRTLVLLLACR